MFVVKQFIQAMMKHTNRFIDIPIDKNDIKKKIEEFQCLSKFPNVVGATDDTHTRRGSRI